MLKNFFNHIRLVNEAGDAHLSLAFGTNKRVCFIDFTDRSRTSAYLGDPVNTAFGERVPAFSRDGHWMFFVSYRPGSEAMTSGASLRTNIHDDFGWQPPINLGAGVNSETFDAGAAFFENDEAGTSLIFFGSTRAGGPGEKTSTSARRPRKDRSAPRRSCQSWSVPMNLGPVVNSTSNDAPSYLSSDGRVLFMTSGSSGWLRLRGTSTSRPGRESAGTNPRAYLCRQVFHSHNTPRHRDVIGNFFVPLSPRLRGESNRCFGGATLQLAVTRACGACRCCHGFAQPLAISWSRRGRSPGSQKEPRRPMAVPARSPALMKFDRGGCRLRAMAPGRWEGHEATLRSNTSSGTRDSFEATSLVALSTEGSTTVAYLSFRATNDRDLPHLRIRPGSLPPPSSSNIWRKATLSLPGRSDTMPRAFLV